MSAFTLIIIVVALGIIVSNIMLLKYSAKLTLKNLKQDPIENAKKELERRKQEDSNTEEDHKQK